MWTTMQIKRKGSQSQNTLPLTLPNLGELQADNTLFQTERQHLGALAKNFFICIGQIHMRRENKSPNDLNGCSIYLM